MLVLTSVPTVRVKWALHSPKGKRNRTYSDTNTQEQFNTILESVAKDTNGHHVALHLVQGYPPSYLVALVQRVLTNMVAFSSLSHDQKERATVQDFMTRDMVRMNVGHDARAVMDQELMMQIVKEGLRRAEAPEAKPPGRAKSEVSQPNVVAR
jgi:hypothetical protein